MKKYIILALLLQVSASLLFAQERVKGVVVTENEKGRLSPAPYANVYWEGTNYGTSTDSNGVFQLAVPEGAKKLITSYLGFHSDTTEVTDFDAVISINLQSNGLTLGPVDIDYRRKASEMSFINPISTINMNERELLKAACCNLSESFETNPSVDVNFTDAITGTRQIRMLGLNGPYTMISRENMQGIRGAANAFGLSFIPGTWVNSIQVSKGVGTVVNGFESIAGQINIELKKPELGELTEADLFVNAAGRTELNFIHTEQVTKNWGTTTLLHANGRFFEVDQNDDGFRDFPLQQQINLLNRWRFNTSYGLMGQFAIHYLKDEKEGGQTDELVDKNSDVNFVPYRLEINTESIELFGKLGYVFAGHRFKSMGFLWSVKEHDQNSFFGVRNYDVNHKSIYANWIYQSIIGNSNHQFKTGLSFSLDDYDEQFESNSFNRVERVPGSFFEYTYMPNNNFTLVAGARADYHSIYEEFFTPRLHLRYALSENTVLRGLVGSGQKSPTTLIDRQSLMATSRSFEFLGTTENGVYGLEMERAWNFGMNLTKSFTLDYREGFVQLDFYRTNFENQVVVDLDNSSNTVLFYNLGGKSYSNTAQFQLDYELIKFLDLRLAYRWVEVKTRNTGGLLQQPFTPEHRFFINFGYQTAKNIKEGNWAFDLTTQWFGEQRIPTTEDNLEENRRASNSPDFVLVNAQITRHFSKYLSVFVGSENVLNYRQDNPIIDADNPFGNEFDASMVWGPIFGRNIYGGLRWELNRKKK